MVLHQLGKSAGVVSYRPGAFRYYEGICDIGTIMHLVCAWLALLAAPFWETKAPSDWTDAQIERLLHDTDAALIASRIEADRAARTRADIEADLAEDDLVAHRHEGCGQRARLTFRRP